MICLAPLLAVSAPLVSQEITTEPVALNYLTPAALAYRLDPRSRGEFPIEVGKVTLVGASPDGRSVLVRATPGSRAFFRNSLVAIDRKLRTARIAVQVVQAEFAPDGSVRETPLLSAFRPALPDREPVGFGIGTRSAGGFGFRGLCRIDGDQVSADFRLDRGRKPLLREREATFKELSTQKPVRVCGLVDRANADIQKAVADGGKPPVGKARKVFYVDARLVSSTPAPGPDERQDIVALKYLEPSELSLLVGKLDGVISTVSETQGKALLLEGPGAALQAARARIAALDRPPAPVTLVVRLVRIDFPVEKTPTETLVKETTLTTSGGVLDLDAAPIPLSFHLRAVPSGEKKAWVFPQLRFRVVPANTTQRERTMVAGVPVEMQVGQARRLGGVPRTTDPSVYASNPKKRAAWEAMVRGAEPQSGFPITTYFVDVVLLKVGA